ncbi:MAG TPA: hypothetical protein VGF06_04140 [Terriglobales bacterium]
MKSSGSVWCVPVATLCMLAVGCGGGHNGQGGQGGTPPPPAGSVTVSVDPASASVIITQTQQFTATVQNASDTTVKWSVNGVAGGNSTVGTISSSGLYTAPVLVPDPGQFNVTATSNADASKSANSSLTVSPYSGVLTYHGDNARDGENLNENTLAPSNVNSTEFGKLFAYAVDGQVFAQPLYVSHVEIAGKGAHNVVYVVTEHDTVDAFDADSGGGAPLWSVSFIKPAQGITTIPSSDLDTPVQPEIGITSTPVIDPNTGTLYVLAGTKESGSHVHRLHALDLATGAEKFGGPVIIQGSVSGTGTGSAGGQIVFTSSLQLQRSALLLSNGTVYVAFASHNDIGNYHGWIMGYDAATLQQKSIWNSTPTGNRGGIWQAGCGLSADSAGNLYVVIGNGSFNANSGGNNYGDSVVRFTADLAVSDYFTPFNQADLASGDVDLGSSGLVVFPDQSGTVKHLGVTAGKEGRIYLLNLDDMGKFNATNDSQAVESLPQALGTTANGRNLSTAVLWQGNVFYTGRNDFAKQFKLNNGLLSTTPVQQATKQFGFSAASALSADGSANGILWTIEGGANILHAYDAANISTELYNTTQAGSRDSFGTGVRFSVPLIANGKVYIPGQTQLTVYGLLH